MEIEIEPKQKSIIVRIGARRIFGKDKGDLASNEERVKRFDEAWERGLHSALQKAIRDGITVDSHVVKNRLETSYAAAVRYFEPANIHFEFIHENLLMIAALEPLIDTEKYKLHQLWSFTYSDLPPDMLCVRFDSADDKTKFDELSKEIGRDSRDVAKDALIQRMREMIGMLEIQKHKLNLEVTQYRERRRQSNIGFYEQILVELNQRLTSNFAETSGDNSWQSWIYRNNWLFGVQYGEPIEKARVGFQSVPDYIFPTLDGFIDILEIKKPTHLVIKKDPSHPGSYNWSSEVNKAVGQVINYLHEIELHQLELTQKISREYPNFSSTQLLTVKPRAFILIGSSAQWSPTEVEAFRKLNYSLHGITVLTYEHLVLNCQNLIDLYYKNLP